MNPTNISPSFQLGALFVDGIFFLGGAQSVGFDDIERVEVIRGPQAAYFGRSTFGGAINYITKDPGESFGGKLTAAFDSRNGYTAAGAVDGPLGDKVGARLSASMNRKGKQYTATDGGDLGEEKTGSAAATIVFRPSDAANVKLRASYSRDDDGAPTATAFSYAKQGNCAVGTAQTFLNTAGQSLSGRINTPYHCGAIPFGQRITSNTTLPTTPFPAALFTGSPAGQVINAPLDVRAALVNNSFNSPLLANAPALSDIGLVRNTERYSMIWDYDLTNALTLSGNIGRNVQNTNSIRDSDYSDTTAVYIAAPYSFRDTSAEMRLRYDDGGSLRALIGVNGYKQKVNAGFANAVEATYGFGGTVAAPGSRPHPLANGSSFDKIRTLGIFGSIDYDIMSNLTATFEGRYQDDKVTRFGGTFANGVVELPDPLRGKNFLPRAILSYKPMEDMTVYASFARGTLPGDINGNIATLTPSDRAEALALLGSIEASVPPEKLDSFELGLKQTLMDGALRYALTGYYMDWKNQKSSASVFLTVARTQTFRVTGNSRIKGLEFETNFAATPNLELGATASYTHARYKQFKLPGNGPLFGVNTIVGYNASGNTLPRFPAYSGSLSGTWSAGLTGDWDWYLRGDMAYTGKTYIDELSLAWVKAYMTANLRFGVVNNDAFTVELFANNLFDKEAWATGSGGFDLTTIPIQTPLFPGVTPAAVAIPRGATLTPIDRQTFGARMTYKF
jgi:iron complex outermembrane receptor protein